MASLRRRQVPTQALEVAPFWHHTNFQPLRLVDESNLDFQVLFHGLLGFKLRLTV